MANLSSLAERMSVASTTRHRVWENIFEQFSRLRADLLAGIQFEESEIFPQLVPWAAPFQKQISRGEFCALVKIVERLHARCLQMIWRLLRLTRDEICGQAGDRNRRQFCDQLATVCEDYEQHLLEVDCLLLPGVAPCEAESDPTSVGPQSFPIARVILASCEHHFRYAKRRQPC